MDRHLFFFNDTATTEIYTMEKTIEHSCMNLLALQQPLARDLRVITATLKILTDMERVADQCADICEILSTVAGMAGQTASPRLLRMFGKARSMFAGALDAYLRLVAGKPDTRLVLEMKSLSDLRREDLAAEKIVKALRKYNLLDRTDIIAFSINACLAFKKLLPDGRIFYLNGDLSPRSIKGLGLTGIDYSMRVLRKHPEWVEQAKKLGLEVNVWTVDEEEDMRYFIDLGVDYITTDYPERLQALLK